MKWKRVLDAAPWGVRAMPRGGWMDGFFYILSGRAGPFTLYADTRKGRRPSFVDAAHPDKASPLVDKFTEILRACGVPAQQGAFGAHMEISLLNDGPMTILLERNSA